MCAHMHACSCASMCRRVFFLHRVFLALSTGKQISLLTYFPLLSVLPFKDACQLFIYNILFATWWLEAVIKHLPMIFEYDSELTGGIIVIEKSILDTVSKVGVKNKKPSDPTHVHR